MTFDEVNRIFFTINLSYLFNSEIYEISKDFCYEDDFSNIISDGDLCLSHMSRNYVQNKSEQKINF